MFLGAAAAVEDEVELRFLAVFGNHRVLSGLKNLRAELHCARLVGAVHIAKGGGEHVPANALQALVHGKHVLRGGIEFLGRRVFTAR